MKSFKFNLPGINPIYRDLMLIFLAGMFASSVMVTMGYVIFSRV
jgi:hypothetical protein